MNLMIDEISPGARESLRKACGYLGPELIARGLPALEHAPVGSWCQCFVGAMHGTDYENWSEEGNIANLRAIAKFEGANLEAWFAHHTLSNMYETWRGFPEFIRGWLAEKAEAAAAIETVTQGELVHAG